MNDSERPDTELGDALIDFFTNEVPIHEAPKGLRKGQVYWEVRGRWKCPWRITGYEKGVAQGYPCGEPVKV
jgi:hypothetical protein